MVGRWKYKIDDPRWPLSGNTGRKSAVDWIISAPHPHHHLQHPPPQYTLEWMHKYQSAVFYATRFINSAQNTSSSSTASPKQKQTRPFCCKRCQQHFTLYAPFQFLGMDGYHNNVIFRLGQAVVLSSKLVPGRRPAMPLLKLMAAQK